MRITQKDRITLKDAVLVIEREGGVKEYGWGKWNQISQYMETRDPTQVKNFSTTVIGRRIRPSRVLTKGYLSLAAGIQVVAEELRAHNPAENENQIENGQDSEFEELSSVKRINEYP